jgi:hypothetical protein
MSLHLSSSHSDKVQLSAVRAAKFHAENIALFMAVSAEHIEMA